MSGQFSTYRVARKTYDCATCTGKVKPGEPYTRITFPPGSYDWGDTDRWTTYITHRTPAQCTFEEEPAHDHADA